MAEDDEKEDEHEEKLEPTPSTAEMCRCLHHLGIGLDMEMNHSFSSHVSNILQKSKMQQTNIDSFSCNFGMQSLMC